MQNGILHEFPTPGVTSSTWYAYLTGDVATLNRYILQMVEARAKNKPPPVREAEDLPRTDPSLGSLLYGLSELDMPQLPCHDDDDDQSVEEEFNAYSTAKRSSVGDQLAFWKVRILLIYLDFSVHHLCRPVFTTHVSDYLCHRHGLFASTSLFRSI